MKSKDQLQKMAAELQADLEEYRTVHTVSGPMRGVVLCQQVWNQNYRFVEISKKPMSTPKLNNPPGRRERRGGAPLAAYGVGLSAP